MSKIFSTLFLISLIAYFAFATIEEFIPGFVSNYLNPHLLLMPTILFFGVTLVLERGKAVARDTPRPRSLPLLIFAAGLITLGLLWIGGRELAIGWRSLMALYGGLLVVGMLMVLLRE